MPLTEKQMSHPNFWNFQAIANLKLQAAFTAAGLSLETLHRMGPHSARVVDEMVALMIRAEKQAKH